MYAFFRWNLVCHAHYWHIFSLISFIVLGHSGHSNAQPSPFEQFQHDCQGKWASLKQNAAKSCVIEGSLQRHDSLSKNLTRVVFVTKQRKDSYLYEIKSPSGMKGDRFKHREVRSVNSHYRFIANDTGNGWLMDGMEKLNDARKIDPLLSARKAGLDFFDTAWSVGGQDFPAVLSSPGFKVLAYNPKYASNDSAGVELTFSVPSPSDPRKEMKVGITKGKVIFDPENDWRVTNFEYTSSIPGKDNLTTGKIDYRNEDGFIAKFSQITKIGDYTSTTIISTDSVSLKEPAEKEFSLSAYGLPEPMGVNWKKPRSRTWLWLLLGAVGATFLAFIFRRLKSRHAMSPK